MKVDQKTRKQIDKPKLSFSIADFPLPVAIESLFALAASLPVDGVEMMIGFKTRFTLKKLVQLSQEYQVPILSVHQPTYTWFGYINDERAFRVASEFHALYVSHPIFTHSLASRQNKSLFSWLVRMREKYHTDVAVENMPLDFSRPILKQIISVSSEVSDLSKLEHVYREYSLGLNFDVSHLEKAKPWEDPAYQRCEKYLKNIHFSDFAPGKQHLYIGDGVLDAKGYIDHLKKIHYSGLITLELGDKLFANKRAYIEGITRSVLAVHEYLH